MRYGHQVRETILFVYKSFVNGCIKPIYVIMWILYLFEKTVQEGRSEEMCNVVESCSRKDTACANVIHALSSTVVLLKTS